MKRPVTGLSYDFIFPKLHGMWSRSVVGDTLQHLIQSGRAETLERALAGLDIDTSNRAEFQRRLTEAHIGELAHIARLVDERTAAFYDAFLDRYFFENLKTILHYHHFPDQEVAIDLLLIQSDSLPPIDIDRVTAAKNVNQLYNALPEHEVKGKLLRLLVELDDTKDLFLAESRLDRFYYEEFGAATRGLPQATRGRGKAFVGTEVDIENLIVAFRNAAVYRLGSEALKDLWIAGGDVLETATLQALAESADRDKGLALLPRTYARIVARVADQQLYVVENELWSYLHRIAYEAFSDFNRPHGAVVAFPYLKRFELLNIGRVFEGIHFGLAPDTMRRMMIGTKSA